MPKRKHKKKGAKDVVMTVKDEVEQANGPANDPEDEEPTKQEAPATTESITTSSLDALQSKESRNVIDIVDRLRRSGLSGILQLPQLVVSGDQSSGKSSVLEAITEIPFPRKENLCTRFATEIVLRRATTASISTKIIPDKVRPATEKKRLEDFKSTIIDFNELPTLMEEATVLMGLGDDGTGPARAFSRDVLSIEIAGPNRPHLTLVDLPGLIHSENKMQSAEDVELIRGLVDDYIKEKRPIIMAVVSAKNDYANQIILKKCRNVDSNGNRTLGIITKPDFLEPDSENETSWMELANNHDIFLQLGWHILKNRTGKEADTTFEARNASESAFFAKGRYREMSSEMLGIATLRTRLSQLLYKHLKTELPALQKELNEKYSEVCHQLELLGDKRATAKDQRRYLMGVSSSYQDIVKAGVDGRYEDAFFGTLDTEQPLDGESNMRRLRALIQHLNLQFANAIRQYGHTSRIQGGEEYDISLGIDDSVETELNEDYSSFSKLQETIDREDAVLRVRRILARSRGRELPGTFNPLLISELFWEQSKNWKIIADYHTDNVAEHCSTFVRAAIDFTVASDVSNRLQAVHIDNSLNSRLAAAKTELAHIIDDIKHHPITYDSGFIQIVQEARAKKHTSKMDELVNKAETSIAGYSDRYLNSSVVKTGIKDLMEVDMDQASAEDALNSQLAYYKEEVKYFVAAVTKQVVERYLLRDLAANTLSPLTISDMTDEQVGLIAAEPGETTRERDHLEARKAILEKGQKTFKSALGRFK